MVDDDLKLGIKKFSGSADVKIGQGDEQVSGHGRKHSAAVPLTHLPISRGSRRTNVECASSDARLPVPSASEDADSAFV